MNPEQQAATQALARQLAQTLRDQPPAAGREGLVQGLLQEYALSSQEGVALMCLAEALLRIPDAATRNALIRDKIGHGQWASHLGNSRSLFVNAATWGLLLTGKLVATHSESGLQKGLARLLRLGGEPLVRKGVNMAMRLMGEQFVIGETIGQALSRAQYLRVVNELYPVLLSLVRLAQHHQIGLNIDAEEADRLELSLDLLEKLCMEPDLAGFDGIGFVVQGYQKRCPAVIDWLVGLARRSGHRLMARRIQATLAQRLSPLGHPIPLIAETGGQNAMIVDASALPEQVVQDVIASAFDSAGQRCSALRVLCVQDDIYDRVLTMLKGAMAEQRLGLPTRLSTDIGPVIDAEARSGIESHIAHMRKRGHAVFQAARAADSGTRNGHFVMPTLIEIPHLGELEREVFGPVLHVIRYARRELPQIIEQINATGYGLTLGVHSRIDETIAQITEAVHAGNQYVNRNMVGAVVGVQPFGGEGLSGTGPKAGGPLYLYRLLAQRPADALAQALPFIGASVPGEVSAEIDLPGPTGERNRSRLKPCGPSAA